MPVDGIALAEHPLAALEQRGAWWPPPAAPTPLASSALNSGSAARKTWGAISRRAMPEAQSSTVIRAGIVRMLDQHRANPALPRGGESLPRARSAPGASAACISGPSPARTRHHLGVMRNLYAVPGVQARDPHLPAHRPCRIPAVRAGHAVRPARGIRPAPAAPVTRPATPAMTPGHARLLRFAHFHPQLAAPRHLGRDKGGPMPRVSSARRRPRWDTNARPA